MPDLMQHAWFLHESSDGSGQWVIAQRGGELIGQWSRDVVSALHKAIDEANMRGFRVATMCRVERGYAIILDEIPS